MQLSDYEQFPAVLPIVVEDSLFFYPFMISPIFLKDQKDIDAATEAMENDSLLFVTTTQPGREGDRTLDALHPVGVVGNIMRRVQMPDGRVKILFQGFARGRAFEPIDDEAMLKARIAIVENGRYSPLKVEALLMILREKIKQLSGYNSAIPADLIKTIEENDEPHRTADLVSSMLHMDKNKAYTLYAEEDIEKRLLGLIDEMVAQIEAFKVQQEIHTKVHNKIEQTNKEYFLKEQLKEIQEELGVDTQHEEEIAQFREKLEALKPHINEDGYKEVKKQLDRLARMHPDSGDANILTSYLEWVFEIPFGHFAKGNLDGLGTQQVGIKNIGHGIFGDGNPIVMETQEILYGLNIILIL